MELVLLDSNFEPVSAPIDRYYSLTWRERYYDAGEFTLVISPDYMQQVHNALYVYSVEADEAMMITDVSASDTGTLSLSLAGATLSTMFRWRVLNEVETIDGDLETAVRSIVTKYAMTDDRAISGLVLGDAVGLGVTASAQSKIGETLYDWLCELLKPLEIGWRVHYDYRQNVLKFEMYKGVDRTQDQSENSFAVFSSSYENLSQFHYNRNTVDYRNYAIVANGSAVVHVDQTDGRPRRELYVDGDDEMTTAELEQLGIEALAEYTDIERISGEVQAGTSLVYGVDYNLGDLCDLADEQIGVNGKARLTEMTTIVEDGRARQTPAFGESFLGVRAYVEREVKRNGGSGGGGGTPFDPSGLEADIADLVERVEALEESGSSGLPDGYTPLTYLASTGTQYIDTDFIPNQDTRVVCTASVPVSSNANGVFGSRYSPAYRAYIFVASSEGRYGVQYGSDRLYFDPSLNTDQFITIDMNKNTTSINDVTITGNAYTFTAPTSMVLFGYDTNGSVTKGKIQMGTCQIYDNGTLVRDYVPCINPSGVYGMYDKVNATFNKNAGTGSFTGG